MDIQSVVIGGGPIASLVVLSTREERGGGKTLQLPIRIGTVEATAISMGVEARPGSRPMTHDLLCSTLEELGAVCAGARITGVQGTMFFAQLELMGADGTTHYVDARPSDALAVAVRTQAPIYADDSVLATAALPDFRAVEADEAAHELEEFHRFLEDLSPDDFNVSPCDDGTE